MAIHPGDILAGYRVTRLLGRGGMGEVWAAVSGDGAHRDVAIKVLLARAALKPDLVRRFEREARIASAIKSPYVCQLIEVGAAPDGAHLLVFEQLTGESLADRLKREQYLPFSEVGPIIDDVLQGLAAAHEAGVIHRDLKPGNIFLVEQQGGPLHPDADGGEGGPLLERRERAKILDFGISKLSRRDKEDPTLTAFDATLGSFAYMAPEQVRGAARADERADIYAVGAVAFRALSGRLPFEASTAHVLVALKLERDAPSLAEATGDQWPAGVERFLERALALKRELRFATAGEALEVWRSIQPSAIPRSVPLPGPSPSMGAPPPYPRPAEVVPAVGSAPRPAAAVLPAPSVPAPRPSQPSLPRPPAVPPAPPSVPRTAKAPSGLIPAPTKPVVTVYGARPLPPPAPPAPVPPPAVRPPLESFQPVDDPPTEVDGPPTMTIDNYNPEPLDQAKRRNAGRP